MECKTGFPIPGDVEFVEYMGKQSKKAGGHKKGKVTPSPPSLCVVTMVMEVLG